MQVPPGSHRDFDLDCSPIVVAVMRQGWFILEGWDNITSPVSKIHWRAGNPVSFSEWENKVKSGDDKKLYDTVLRLNIQWCGGCSSLLFIRTAHLELSHRYDCWGTESHTFSLPSPLHPKSQNIPVLEGDRKKCKKPFESVLLYPHSNLLQDSKLGMVHFVQPWGRAGGEVRVSCTAACGEVWGWTASHGSQGLSHAARPTLHHETVHAEAQVVEERGVAGQRSDGGGRLRETIGAACSDVVVGLSRCIDREATVQHRTVGHVTDTPIKPIGVAEIWEDLVICGGDNST